ncbi:MAG: thiamine pyrophosphate-dependent dehydrogenase E1 component subunit alpha [Candidatus Poribacteria bacterium]|nr:thiamine pyrophosphate-dependent dehydrogenase E1 component subunit alpha [Candidatus Poribacteria bacterium]
MDIPRDKLLEIYERMVTIRQFEDRTHGEYAAGRIPGFVHLYAGEEAVAVGVCAHLSDDDAITSTHRGHGHRIAKGVDVNAMMAELYGRATGACKGKGGSMHIADISRGMLGANGIVGAGVPLACGAALSAQVRGTEAVAVSFFGDGGANQGTFHEGLNLAAIWKLPVLFVAENNGYAQSTSVSYAAGGADIARRAQAYGIPGVVADGLDLFDVYAKAGTAIAAARAGDGPTLLECKTYRLYGHYEGDTQGYRSKAEIDRYRHEHCAIRRFRARVTQDGLLTADELDAIDARVDNAIDAAVAFAANSPFPDPAEVTTDVYVNYEEEIA